MSLRSIMEGLGMLDEPSSCRGSGTGVVRSISSNGKSVAERCLVATSVTCNLAIIYESSTALSSR